mmetsp:Transcript_9710/g.13184  ORF Transcript_9710/g.13184 Transcript_9710/m.13184 type:complete len:515 (-) Transcript_9710:262-1806(-)
MENNEPNVINDELVRICIQLEGPAENLEEKRKGTDFREVEGLSFSFRNIQKIDNLRALDCLSKLQLDNNQIQKIEKIEHLVNLTWLDLSFNKLTKIEGLNTLTKLTDLSLHDNQITVIENLDSLKELNVFSIGNNKLENMENVMYLRRFHNLRLVNLAGNIFCKDPEYHSYVLSHIKDLKYLDYRLVDKASVAAAREQYQDEMMELEERENQQRIKGADDKQRAEHDSLMSEANMGGVEQLFDDMLREDVEYQKLKTISKLTESVTDFKEKFTVSTEEFRTQMLGVHEAKKDERALWQSVMDKATGEKDQAARDLIISFEKLKKHAFRDVRDDPSRAEHALKIPKEKNVEMKEQLMELEMQTVEVVQELNQEFERNYSELVDASKAQYATYFGTVRELENVYSDLVSQSANTLLDDFVNNKLDDNVTEDARNLLADKETLMNSVQASHDAHTSKIDGLEDALVQKELKDLNDIIAKDKAWEHKRNRDRIAEIYNLVERNKAEIEEMLTQDDMGD